MFRQCCSFCFPLYWSYRETFLVFVHVEKTLLSFVHIEMLISFDHMANVLIIQSHRFRFMVFSTTFNNISAISCFFISHIEKRSWYLFIQRTALVICSYKEILLLFVHIEKCSYHLTIWRMFLSFIHIEKRSWYLFIIRNVLVISIYREPP